MFLFPGSSPYVFLSFNDTNTGNLGFHEDSLTLDRRIERSSSLISGPSSPLNGFQDVSGIHFTGVGRVRPPEVPLPTQ